VSGQIEQTPGALGYVELIYAAQNKMPVAELKNAAGNYVSPTTDSVMAALDSARIPDDFRFSMTDAPGGGAYPIAGATWLLVYQRQGSADKGKKLVEFLRWALTTGEGMAQPLDYAPLPPALCQRVLKRIAEIQVGG
jgi:phosphate transport system substrate-binding protein